MKVFADANVLVAVLNKQYPLFPHASRVLSLVDSKWFSVYTSPICLAIAFYFAEKKNGTQLAKKKIALLSENLDIATTDETAVKQTAQNPAVNDFEDGLEYYSAIDSGCEVIVSEDVGDFHFSEIPVFNCETFLKNL